MTQLEHGSRNADPREAMIREIAAALCDRALEVIGETVAGGPLRDASERAARAAVAALVQPGALERVGGVESALSSGRLADALFPSIREDLLAASRRRVASAEWLYPGPELYLCVDRTALTCAHYLAGTPPLERDSLGADHLPAVSTGRSKRVSPRP